MFHIICVVSASPPTPLQGERGVKCLVGAWWLCLFVLEITLHSLLFALLLHYILLPSPLGEGSGVRPVEVGGEAGWGGCEAGRDWK